MNKVEPVIDGRAARWEEHNAQRRRELVEGAVKAIREYGPAVGMDEIAAMAETSKTVLYRHFGDKAGLYQAVVDSVHDFILRKLPLADVEHLNPAELVIQVADAYLAVVERDRNLYLFVTSRPTGETPTSDPVGSITTRIGNRVAEAMRAWLQREGLSEDPANIWAHGSVGFIWAVADRWIVTNLRRPRADVVAHVHQFFAPAFEAQKLPPERATHPFPERASATNESGTNPFPERASATEEPGTTKGTPTKETKE